MAKEVSFLIKIRDDGGAKRVTANAEEVGRVIRSVQDEAERLKRDVLTWSEAAQAVGVLQNAIGELQGVFKDLTEAYQVQLVAETQLETIMRQRMNSTDEEIQHIKNLCSAQQELGVIGDEVQLSGAQQMATFLKQKESLDVLIPAMNNLIAQQNGLNATNQDAVGIGNMMGKAMQGQTAVLQRVGITFDEAQAHVLQYGTESERAAMLAEVITANVGNMNAELAKTDAGKQKQLENTLGDIKEKLGSMVQGAMPFVTITAQAMICVAGCIKLITSIQALGAAFSLTAIKGALLAVHEGIVAGAQRILSISGYTAAGGTLALSAAVTVLYGALTMGLSVVITGIISLFTNMGNEAEDTAESVNQLKESEDAFSQASSNMKAELDVEISRLASLIHNHENASKKVSELNKKYGESFGYHRTAAEWYDTLIEKSKVYSAQMGYEAQAKVLSSQIAAAQLEKESKEAERRQLGQQYMDTKGEVHYNWENAQGGKDHYTQLGSDINEITSKVNSLQKQYDSAIRHMVDAQKQLDQSRKSTKLVNGNLKASTTEELKVMGLDGVKKRIKELQDMLRDTKNPLGKHQREEVEKLINSYGQYEKVLRKSDVHLTDLWGNTKGVAGGISSMTNALEGGRNAWETLTGVVDGAIQIFQSIAGIVDIIKAMTGATQASAAASGVKASATATETAATATHTAATAADTAATITNTAAKGGMAIASATASGASMPFPYNIVAIAAGVAAVVAALASISGAFANGGIVGGSSPSGDKLLARVNSGEMILNGAQQSRLFNFINGVTPFADGGIVYGPTLSIMGEYAGARSNPEVIAPLNKLKSIIGDGGNGGGRLEARLRGRDIVLAMANETRINRRKTNIKL